MRKLATMADFYLYGTRMRIELNFRNLKLFYGLVTSLPRSLRVYIANYAYSLLAYILG
jgi:IS4 transposase